MHRLANRKLEERQLADRKLWDIAGVDGLEVAQLIFGQKVGYLAPFQSIEATLKGQDCSVLRLCEKNFRISYSGPLDQIATPLQRRAWIKQYDWLHTLFLPIEQLPTLLKRATVRAPHRLANLPNNQAVPACLEDTPILIWRHCIAAQPTAQPTAQPKVELHLPRQSADIVIKQLEHLSSSAY